MIKYQRSAWISATPVKGLEPEFKRPWCVNTLLGQKLFEIVVTRNDAANASLKQKCLIFIG
jgi:hypothetical protein